MAVVHDTSLACGNKEQMRCICSFVALLNDVVLDAAGRGIGKPVQAKHSIKPMQHGEPKKLHDVVDDVSTRLAACFVKLGVHFYKYKPVGLMT